MWKVRFADTRILEKSVGNAAVLSNVTFCTSEPRLIHFPCNVLKPQHIDGLVSLLPAYISHTAAKKLANPPPFLFLFQKAA